MIAGEDSVRAHQRSRYVRFGALGEFDIEVVRRAVFPGRFAEGNPCLRNG